MILNSKLLHYRNLSAAFFCVLLLTALLSRSSFSANTPVGATPAYPYAKIGLGSGKSTSKVEPSKSSNAPLNPSVVSVELEGSLDAFGKQDITPYEQGVKSRAFVLDILYQPEFLRHFGTFGIGPSFGLYPTTGNINPADAATPADANQPVTGGVLDLYHIGLKVQYQFEYLVDQWIVPHVSYNWYSFQYAFLNNISGSVLLDGPSAGVHIPLNHIDRTGAKRINDYYSVKRTSLVIEAKDLRGGDSNIAVNGVSYYLGVKLEW